MKAMLYAASEQSPSAEVVEPEVLKRYKAKFDDKFFHYCDKELKKINTFYSGTIANVIIFNKSLCLGYYFYFIFYFRKISRSN